MSTGGLESPQTIHGRLMEAVHIAGYTFDRACSEFEHLLEEGRWCSLGFATFDEFLSTLNWSEFRISAERRKKIARLCAEADASQRATARMLGVDESTVRADLGRRAGKPATESDCGANNGHALFTVAGNPARPWFQRDVDPARLAKGQERLDKKLAAARARAAELAARNAALPLGDRHYACILDDPPWRYHFPREIGPEVHYATMSDDEILAFHLRGIAQLAAPDCALFLWTVDAKLELAFAVIQACGFQYRTRAFDWVKTTKDGNGLASGFGHHWTVPGSESCLLATRGNPVRLHADVQQVILAPRREHSRKPDEVAARIERLVPGPYIELFARSPREGWAAWGNEAADAEDDDD